MLDTESPFKRLEFNHRQAPFDCGSKDLNDFFLNDAKDYQRKLLAVTYSFEIDNKTVVFFTLSNDKITSTEQRIGRVIFSKSFFRKLKEQFHYSKHRNEYPAVKIGRFGVHKDFQHSEVHWGQHTLDFIKQWMVSRNKTGCCFITVDAYATAVGFYLKNGFEFLGINEEKAYKEWEQSHSSSEDDNVPTFAMYFNLLKVHVSTSAED